MNVVSAGAMLDCSACSRVTVPNTRQFLVTLYVSSNSMPLDWVLAPYALASAFEPVVIPDPRPEEYPVKPTWRAKSAKAPIPLALLLTSEMNGMLHWTSGKLTVGAEALAAMLVNQSILAFSFPSRRSTAML